MVRPIRNDSQRNARRGLAREQLRSQCEHDTHNNTFHIQLPGVDRNTRIRVSASSSRLTLPNAFSL